MKHWLWACAAGCAVGLAPNAMAHGFRGGVIVGQPAYYSPYYAYPAPNYGYAPYAPPPVAYYAPPPPAPYYAPAYPVAAPVPAYSVATPLSVMANVRIR